MAGSGLGQGASTYRESLVLNVLRARTGEWWTAWIAGVAMWHRCDAVPGTRPGVRMWISRPPRANRIDRSECADPAQRILLDVGCGRRRRSPIGLSRRLCRIALPVVRGASCDRKGHSGGHSGDLPLGGSRGSLRCRSARTGRSAGSTVQRHVPTGQENTPSAAPGVPAGPSVGHIAGGPGGDVSPCPGAGGGAPAGPRGRPLW